MGNTGTRPDEHSPRAGGKHRSRGCPTLPERYSKWMMVAHGCRARLGPMEGCSMVVLGGAAPAGGTAPSAVGH